MHFLFYFGLALACTGLVGIIAAIVMANSIRVRNQKREDAKSNLEKLIPLNYASLLVAVLGLCAMAVAVVLD
ncbi:MAG: hypothetical protein OXI87_17830 [Albidovulum sp.]|nr:hypothetical protein [Albidovulum sp.]MDE0529851.1 hypothetical protein [Albidovulum sp.]